MPPLLPWKRKAHCPCCVPAITCRHRPTFSCTACTPPHPGRTPPPHLCAARSRTLSPLVGNRSCYRGHPTTAGVVSANLWHCCCKEYVDVGAGGGAALLLGREALLPGRLCSQCRQAPVAAPTISGGCYNRLQWLLRLAPVAAPAVSGGCYIWLQQVSGDFSNGLRRLLQRSPTAATSGSGGCSKPPTVSGAATFGSGGCSNGLRRLLQRAPAAATNRPTMLQGRRILLDTLEHGNGRGPRWLPLGATRLGRR
jgi:hypothetical protein